MTPTRTLLAAIVGLVVFAAVPHAQDRARYREFRLGSDLASVRTLSGASASETRTVHERPALMQELQWRRQYVIDGVIPAQTDTVKQMVFSFYNDQLSQIVVDYDPDLTAGMTDADLIDAISTQYGSVSKPAAKAVRDVATQLEQESGTLITRWIDPDFTAALYRSSYASGFRLIVTNPRLAALARTADAQAVRLDRLDEPRREIARQKQEVADARALQAKERLTNKAAFRP